MSTEYYQNEIQLREYFVNKLISYKSKFATYDRFPELRQIYQNVVTEIDNQINEQTQLKEKAEKAKTAPPSVTVSTSGKGNIGCRDDKRYNEFLTGPQQTLGTNGKVNPDVFKMVFGFKEPNTDELIKGKNCSDYFSCIKKNTIVEGNPNGRTNYNIMKLTDDNQGCPESYFDLGKFVEFNGNESDVDLINSEDNVSLEYKFVTGPDIVNVINTGEVKFLKESKDLKLDLGDTIFQAASQVNYLEMAGSDYTPSLGIEIYLNDRTQGPACAIASYPATLYRNSYLTKSDTEQLNSLAECPTVIDNLFIRNGYVRLNYRIGLADAGITEKIIKELEYYSRVGVLTDTEIVLKRKYSNGQYEYSRNIGENVKTSFVWTSAFVLNPDYYWESGLNEDRKLNSIYTKFPGTEENFERVCRVQLIRIYKLTLLAAIKTGKKNVVLTAVGGGAFNNKQEWILEAIRQAIVEYQNYPLKVYYFSRDNETSLKSNENYKIFEDQTRWKGEIQVTPLTNNQSMKSPISLREVKKKRKKEKERKKQPENNMLMERKKREQKIKNLMK